MQEVIVSLNQHKKEKSLYLHYAHEQIRAWVYLIEPANNSQLGTENEGTESMVSALNCVLGFEYISSSPAKNDRFNLLIQLIRRFSKISCSKEAIEHGTFSGLSTIKTLCVTGAIGPLELLGVPLL